MLLELENGGKFPGWLAGSIVFQIFYLSLQTLTISRTNMSFMAPVQPRLILLLPYELVRRSPKFVIYRGSTVISLKRLLASNRHTYTHLEIFLSNSTSIVWCKRFTQIFVSSTHCICVALVDLIYDGFTVKYGEFTINYDDQAPIYSK